MEEVLWRKGRITPGKKAAAVGNGLRLQKHPDPWWKHKVAVQLKMLLWLIQ